MAQPARVLSAVYYHFARWRADGTLEWLRPAAIVPAGRVHLHAPNTPARVTEHLPLAPIHPFMGVEPALLIHARG